MNGGKVTNRSMCSVIDKQGNVTHYVWDDEKKQLVEQTKMVIPRTAVIYSNGSQECERAGALLKSLGGEYLEYRLNQHFSQKAFETEFGPEAEYPQIALGAQHVGHLKELLQYGKENGLF